MKRMTRQRVRENKLHLKSDRKRNTVYSSPASQQRDKAVSPTISTSPVCTCGSQYKDLLLSSPMLDDSTIDQDITWDEHMPTCTCQKEYTSGRFEKILESFPSVDSPVSRQERLTLANMKNKLSSVTPRRKQITKSNLEKLKSLSHFLQESSSNTRLSLNLEKEEGRKEAEMGKDSTDQTEVEQTHVHYSKDENYIAKEDLSIHNSDAPNGLINNNTQDSFYESESLLDQLFMDEDLLTESVNPEGLDVTPTRGIKQQENASTINITNVYERLEHETKDLSTAITSTSTSNVISPSTCVVTKSSPHVRSCSQDFESKCTGVVSRQQQTSNNCLSSLSNVNLLNQQSDNCSRSLVAEGGTVQSISSNCMLLAQTDNISPNLDDEEDVFWTQVAVAMETSDQDAFLTGLDNDTINQIFEVDDDELLTPSQLYDTRLQSSPNKGVYNTESSVLHSSPKRVCSQHDIERKRQLAKKKLQQKIKTF